MQKLTTVWDDRLLDAETRSIHRMIFKAHMLRRDYRLDVGGRLLFNIAMVRSSYLWGAPHAHPRNPREGPRANTQPSRAHTQPSRAPRPRNPRTHATATTRPRNRAPTPQPCTHATARPRAHATARRTPAKKDDVLEMCYSMIVPIPVPVLIVLEWHAPCEANMKNLWSCK